MSLLPKVADASSQAEENANSRHSTYQGSQLYIFSLWFPLINYFNRSFNMHMPALRVPLLGWDNLHLHPYPNIPSLTTSRR